MKDVKENTAKAEVGKFDNALGYSIQYVAENGPVSRSQIYDALRLGQLRGKKLGRRTIITPDAWSEYIDRLPDYPVAA